MSSTSPVWRNDFGTDVGPAQLFSDTLDYKRSVMEHFQMLGIADKVRFAGARNDAPAILVRPSYGAVSGS